MTEKRHEIDDPNRDNAVCPLCEELAATSVVDDTFTWGSGKDAVELHVRDLPVRRCDACDIDFLDEVGERLHTEAVYRHHGLLTPWEIRAIRERRELSRAAFAEVTGLGEATIKRWETGAVAQNRANDRYLRLLDKYFVWNLLTRLNASTKDPAHREPQSRTATTRFPNLPTEPRRSARQAAFRLRRAA